MARYETGNLVKIERSIDGITIKGTARYDIDTDSWTCRVWCGDYLDVRVGIPDVLCEFADMIPLAIQGAKDEKRRKLLSA